MHYYYYYLLTEGGHDTTMSMIHEETRRGARLVVPFGAHAQQAGGVLGFRAHNHARRTAGNKDGKFPPPSVWQRGGHAAGLKTAAYAADPCTCQNRLHFRWHADGDARDRSKQTA